MTALQIFAFIALPLSLAAAGWGIALLNDWNDRRKGHQQAGE